MHFNKINIVSFFAYDNKNLTWFIGEVRCVWPTLLHIQYSCSHSYNERAVLSVTCKVTEQRGNTVKVADRRTGRTSHMIIFKASTLHKPVCEGVTKHSISNVSAQHLVESSQIRQVFTCCCQAVILTQSFYKKSERCCGGNVFSKAKETYRLFINSFL